MAEGADQHGARFLRVHGKGGRAPPLVAFPSGYSQSLIKDAARSTRRLASSLFCCSIRAFSTWRRASSDVFFCAIHFGVPTDLLLRRT
jgi:hypothetical protein